MKQGTLKLNGSRSPKILIILGPTATGKTDIGLNLAKQLNAELVAADSRQVYKNLDIGTGKLPNNYQSLEKHDGFWIIDGIKVWLYDVAEFNTVYSVKEYIEQATAAIDQIIKQEKLPIVVGGTGFYIKGLLEGIPNLEVPTNLELRKSIENLGVEELQKKLYLLSPTRLETMNQSDRNNPRRLQRAIEIEYVYPYTSKNQNLLGLQNSYQVLKLGLTAPLPLLKQKISKRLLNRVSEGLISEVTELQKRGMSLKRMKDLGLEYGVLADLLAGIFPEKEAVEILNHKIYQFAKRQLTWFKKDKEIVWFDISQGGFETQVESAVLEWYDS